MEVWERVPSGLLLCRQEEPWEKCSDPEPTEIRDSPLVKFKKSGREDIGGKKKNTAKTLSLLVI